MKISKIFAAILLCLLVIAATSAYLAGRSRDAQEAAAIQEGTDVSGNSEDFAETEGGAEGEGDIDAPETSAQEAAETEQTEEYGGELPIGDRVKVKGIYVTGNMAGTSNMDNLISLVDRTELNTMVIDIKNDEGRVVYQMDSPMVSELGSAQKLVADMPALVKKCREHGIYLIGRIVAFKDPFLAENRPELALHNQDGSVFRDKSGLAWVNPYSREVWEYLMEIVAQAVAVGFDEIQFDYIRFSTDSGMSKVDFGPEAAGRDKEGTITEFTAYAAQALHQLGVPVSADVYGIIIDSELDASIVGQDYYEMAKYLDYISPMVYPSHYGPGNLGLAVPDAQPYETIYRSMGASREVLAGMRKDANGQQVSGNDASAGGEAAGGVSADGEAGDASGNGIDGNEAPANGNAGNAVSANEIPADEMPGDGTSGNEISGNEILSPRDMEPAEEIRADVRPWLQDFTASWVPGHIKYGPEEIRAQIQAVYDAGYEEWILWNASNRYTEGGLLPAEEAETAGTTETAQEPGNAETAAGPAAENPAD
ncbi:putative glycoside hydrolase [Eisenbergiella porci]|uniref:putative glycoside hydrolase n=1 Tax=Eisenbergiella porci TaxID=2652274 RepID=UPI002A83B117|nr:putative glycoside hydrolase [Eisenbergiella porci]